MLPPGSPCRSNLKEADSISQAGRASRVHDLALVMNCSNGKVRSDMHEALAERLLPGSAGRHTWAEGLARSKPGSSSAGSLILLLPHSSASHSPWAHQLPMQRPFRGWPAPSHRLLWLCAHCWTRWSGNGHAAVQQRCPGAPGPGYCALRRPFGQACGPPGTLTPLQPPSAARAWQGPADTWHGLSETDVTSVVQKGVQKRNAGELNVPRVSQCCRHVLPLQLLGTCADSTKPKGGVDA